MSDLHIRTIRPGLLVSVHARQSGNRSYSGVASTTTLAAVAGLVAAYSFDEGSGDTAGDSSGYGHTGQITGATWTATARYGNALFFDGTTALVTIDDSPELALTTGMTLEAWVKPASASSWRDVIYKGPDSYLLEGSSPIGAPAGGGTINGNLAIGYGPSALALGAWTHLAVTYDAATLRLYLDGVEVSSLPATGDLLASVNPLQIGGNSLYGQHFHGTIDEVRIYNIALSAAELSSNMDTHVTPALPPLRAAGQPHGSLPSSCA